MGNRRGIDIVGLTRRRRSERPIGRTPNAELGQALAEFALVAPIMVLIFAGAAQFALIFERQIGIENAVRDGARRAATYDTTSVNACTNASSIWTQVFGSGQLMQTNVQGYDGSQLVIGSVTYADQGADASGHTSVRVTVTASYRHPLFMPIITQIIDGIDGTLDNALAIQTNSTFTVQNDAAQNSSVGGTVSFPGC